MAHEPTPPFCSKRFAPAIGQPFKWRAFNSAGGEVVVEVTLVELAMRRSPAHIEQYSMLFVGSEDIEMGHGTYTISNDLTGTEAMFASPIGPDASGRMQYEVCVARELESWERAAVTVAT